MFRSSVVRSLVSQCMLAFMLAGFFATPSMAFAGQPDLTATNLVITAAVTPGEYDVTVDYANIGDTDVDPATAGTDVMSINGVSSGSYNWSVLSDTSFLLAGGSVTGAKAFSGSVALSDGDLVEVCIDVTNVAVESDETNNCVSTTFTTSTALPDLIIDSLTFNPSDNSVDFVVNNQGTGDVDGSVSPSLNFYYDFYNSDLSTSTSVSYVMDDSGMGYRTAGGTTTVNSGTLGSELPTCDLYILAVADGNGDVLESDDTNNEYRATIDTCASTLPDFVVSGLKYYSFADGAFVSSIPSGSNPSDYEIYFTLTNNGADATVMFPILTYDEVLDDTGAVLIQHNFEFMGDTAFYYAGGSSDDNAEEIYTGDVDTSGSTTLQFCVDATDMITESDDTNNCLTIDNPFYVAPATEALPDLTVSNLVLDTSDYSFDVSVDNVSPVDIDPETGVVLGLVVESSDGTSPSLPFQLNDYISEGNDYHRSGASGVFSLAGSSEAAAAVASICAERGTMEYTVTATVDSDETLAESNEENNSYRISFDLCASTSSTVSSSPSSTSTSGGGGFGGGSSHHSSSSSTTTATGSEDVVLTSDEVAACGTNPFVDMTTDNPYYDAVQQLWCDGVIHGRDATHFVPAASIKRDEAAKVIARLFGYVTTSNSDLPVVTETSFDDVSTDEPLAYYVQTMTDLGYFDAEKAAGNFRPHDDLSYDELKALLTKVLGSDVSLDGLDQNGRIRRDQFMKIMLDLFQK